MKRSAIAAMFLLFPFANAQSETVRNPDPIRFSRAFLFTGTALDLGTTYGGRFNGMREASPLLGSNPVRQGAIVIGSVVVLDRVTRHVANAGHPKLANFANYTVGAIHFACGGLNLRLTYSLGGRR